MQCDAMPLKRHAKGIRNPKDKELLQAKPAWVADRVAGSTGGSHISSGAEL
jgi:hypothetical protein